MVADDEDRPRTKLAQHAKAGAARLVGVAVGGRRPVGARDLAGMVHKIAGDQRLLTLRSDDHADMAWRMPDRWNEADLLADPVVRLDQIGEAGRSNRCDRV